jgi:hypothetical protein
MILLQMFHIARYLFGSLRCQGFEIPQILCKIGGGMKNLPI